MNCTQQVLLQDHATRSTCLEKPELIPVSMITELDCLLTISHHVGPLGQKKVVELVFQEEASSFAVNRLLPATPSAIHNLLEIVSTSVVWIKDEKSTVATDFIIINSEKGVSQDSST